MAYDLTRLKFHGDDVVISDFAEIKRPHLVSIGNHAAIDSFVSITTRAEIGDYVHISPHVSVIGGSTFRPLPWTFSYSRWFVGGEQATSLAPPAAQARLSDSRQHEPLTFAPRPLDWLIYKDGA
jgi:hypothetical protein